MNANRTSDSGTAMTIDVPVTLRLAAGSAVFAVHGEAWITQDGRRDDVILPAGQRFDVPSRAPLVISATRDHVEIYVVGPAAARLSASCNVHDFARAHAAELRRAETSQWIAEITRRGREVLRRVRAFASPRVRVPTQ